MPFGSVIGCPVLRQRQGPDPPASEAGDGGGHAFGGLSFLSALDRGLFTDSPARFFRDAANPLPPGHTVRLTGLTVTILETGPDGSPVRILFRFGRPLEDPTLRWLRWQDGVYVPFTPPVVGATVHLAPAVGPLERAGGRS